MRPLALLLGLVILASHALSVSAIPRQACLAMTGDPALCAHT